MSDRPWFKISFDSSLPGVARICKTGPINLRKAPGQWVVFDKNKAMGDGGLKTYSGSPLFSADTFDACCRWIDAQRLVQDAKEHADAVRGGSLGVLGEMVSHYEKESKA